MSKISLTNKTIVNKKVILENTKVKAKDSDNIDIGNNNSTIINNLNCPSSYCISYDINGNKQCQKWHMMMIFSNYMDLHFFPIMKMEYNIFFYNFPYFII